MSIAESVFFFCCISIDIDAHKTGHFLSTPFPTNITTKIYLLHVLQHKYLQSIKFLLQKQTYRVSNSFSRLMTALLHQSIGFTLILVARFCVVLVRHTLMTINTSLYIVHNTCFTSNKTYISNILIISYKIILFVKMMTELKKIQQQMLISQSQKYVQTPYFCFLYHFDVLRTLHVLY